MSVVSGQLSVVSGQWSVGGGQWAVVSGRWSVGGGGNSGEGGQAVEFGCVAVQQFFLMFEGSIGDQCAQCGEPVFVGPAQQADRPVASENDSIRPERVEAVIDNRCQCFGKGNFGRCAGNDA